MMNETFAAQLKAKNRSFPLDKQLTLGFHARGHFISSDMYRFYHEAGLRMTNLTLAIQYPEAQPLRGFVDTIAAKRLQATDDGDDIKQNTWKLVANSSWGRLGMNRIKFKKRHVKHQSKQVKYDTFFDVEEHIQGECSTEFMEVVRRYKSLDEATPVHLAFTILSNSKLTMLKTVYNLIQHWDTDAFDLLYTDTDR